MNNCPDCNKPLSTCGFIPYFLFALKMLYCPICGYIDTEVIDYEE